MTPAQRTQRASIAANTRWGREPNRTKATAKARAGLHEKFLRLADPDMKLSEAQREKLAANLKKAHYRRMAMKSAEARRKS